jgi:hypothetical protein
MSGKGKRVLIYYSVLSSAKKPLKTVFILGNATRYRKVLYAGQCDRTSERNGTGSRA